MTTITDEFMREMLTATKPYCIVILKAGPNANHPDRQKIVWEHGRRNFMLRAEGQLAIVCPIADGSDVSGISIFKTNIEETRKFMDEDPAVQAGIFIYELHPSRSFPGDSLPNQDCIAVRK